MASQVLSGASNASYTNNTGQNVRVVINFMRSRRTLERNIFGYDRIPTETLTINWAGISQSYVTSDANQDSLGNIPTVARPVFIGRNLAFVQSIVASEKDVNSLAKNGPVLASLSSSNAVAPSPANDTRFNYAPSETEVAFAFPTEIMLAPNETFSAVCGVHNIVIIPENG